jgi:hypothetical protein
MTVDAVKAKVNSMTYHLSTCCFSPHAAACLLSAGLQMTVDAVKAKVNSMTGTSVLSMTLHLQDESGRLVDVLQEGSKKLGYYSPRDG